MFCSRCGLKVEEGVRYCTACGQEVGSPVTPPQIPASVPVPAPQRYAGFWLRFVAHLIDGIVLGIPFFVVVMVPIFLLGGLRLLAHRGAVGPPDPVFVAAVILRLFFMMAVFVVAQWLYFAGMESSARQATFGKAAMSLRVTGLTGQHLTFGHATGRFFAKIISGLIPLGIGYFMAGFTEKKQALHDMIAGTLVLRQQ
ncbi:MAG: hypothetical protein JWN92_2156 [Candidatus Acidoferrum typicum]|nr:hypothetical protein [Candidatus Acidoferrum typicum]